ncbi:helix-turn-helix domain-containing protein [Sphingomonas elodea]|uniref:helix-turn-helix domain-containing protein n=1 Tax=Sphingomonas elodea TaxID=179878 RepID=UPI000263211B|nr:DUF4019 domain-containing protein [Sphingomonas elodea]
MTTSTARGLDALTEKEKQTLRLIVRGHDAKSIARSLGLSIHTINERLREARRKLAVSSSREAARLLLDAEGEPPKTLEDTQIGEAAGPSDREERASAGRTSRRRPLLIGAIVMPVFLGLLILAALPNAQVPTPAHQRAAIETHDPAILDTARRFLELGDQANWAGSYAMTGKSFQQLNSAEVWARASEKVRVPLGAVKARTLLSEQSLPAPPDGYEVVKFRTRFANKASAVETVTLEREGEAWKVVGVTVG